MGNREPEPCRKVEGSWLLLAEDDDLFASLFCRFFRKRNQERLEVRQVRSLAEARRCLSRSVAPPVFAVMDLNLEDGSGRELVSALTCPHILWSASPEPGVRAKPSGRPALEATVEEISLLAEGQGSPLE